MTHHCKTFGGVAPFKDRGALGSFSRGAISVLVISVFSAVSAGAGPEQNWPAWRGPLGNGIAPQGNPPIQWSETENVRWKVKIPGKGSATPVIWENKIFVQTAIPVQNQEQPAAQAAPNPAPEAAQETPQRGRRGPGGRPGGFGRPNTGAPVEHQFVLLCLDRRSGETIWRKTLREELPHEGHHHHHGYASFSPVTDGKHVYAYFGSRGLYCLDLEGNLVWEKDLGNMRTRMGFGEGSSPALFENVLVINWDHEGDDFIVGLDKRTGDELWRQPRDEPQTWATPLIVQHNGKAQVITSGTRKVRSYDLNTGDLIWETDGLTGNVIPTPVADGEKVYVMSGFGGSAVMGIRLGHSGELTGSDAIAWSHRSGGRSGIAPYVPSPVVYNGKLFFFSHNSGRLTCMDAKTGEPLGSAEPRQIEGLSEVYASPMAVNGRLYLTSRDGVTVVIKADQGLDILATNRLDDPIDASPAVVGSELFLRGQEYLYCIAQ